MTFEQEIMYVVHETIPIYMYVYMYTCVLISPASSVRSSLSSMSNTSSNSVVGTATLEGLDLVYHV